MNKQTIKELEELFVFTSAGSIRQSLQEVFFSYLMHNKQHFPGNYERTVEDFYFLINFLERVEGGRSRVQVIKPYWAASSQHFFYVFCLHPYLIYINIQYISNTYSIDI